MVPMSLRNKVGVLGNISLNIQRGPELPLKNDFDKHRVSSHVEQGAIEKDEIYSASSRSSQSENSDVVKINDNGYISGGNHSHLRNTTLESKPTIALFIGDLHKMITEDILRSYFSQYKSLISVKVCLNSTTGESLGYGYVNFSLKEDADMATEEFNYRPIMGKEVRIMPSLRNAFFRKNMGTNVFFSNLPLENSSLTTRVFYDTFKTYGKILSCKLDNRKNIGFVYFESDQAARNVIQEYNNKSFYGNKVLCGVHFDKGLRKFPDFEKRKSNLESITIPKEELTTLDTEHIPATVDETNQVPHPNAIFVTNLPLDSTNEDILDYFSDIGPVKSVFSSKVIKYNSLWAFVTYKKGSDTKRAIELYNGKIFRERSLKVVKAEPRVAKGSFHEKYKTVVYFENASFVCNEEFLTQLCIQERIKICNLEITSYQEDSMTYSGYIKVNSKNDAKRLFESLNQRLIGGSVIKCLWMKPEKMNTSAMASQKYEQSDDSSSFEQHPQYLFQKQRQQRQQQQQQEQAQMLLLPFCQPLVCRGHSVATQPPYAAPKHSYNNEQQQKQVLDCLKRQVRKGIDFLKFPSATRIENVTCITDYIFDVYWRRDMNALTKFLLLINSNTQKESILQSQIEEAAKFLGFSR